MLATSGCVSYLFAKAASIMERSVYQTFPICGILPPVVPVRSSSDPWQAIHPCTQPNFKLFIQVPRRVFVTTGYFPFGVVAIHLDSFVHVPSSSCAVRGQRVSVDSVSMSWPYVTSDFEERCFSRYAGDLEPGVRGGGRAGSLNWDGLLPFAN